MKVIICGDREIEDFELLEQAIVASGFTITEVVCGEARGSDKLGKLWAKNNNIKCTSFNADWNNLSAPGAVIKKNQWGKEYNANAGFNRNREMSEYADAAIALHTGSPGTTDMISVMKKVNKPVFVYECSNRKKYIF